MFAFAVWDRETRRLHLGRDRLGKKPLYYGVQGNSFLFGSELKALRAHPRFTAGVELLPKAGCEPKRFVREIRGPAGELAVGGQIKVDALADVKSVDITGISKGRGFAGAIKRHNFSGQRATHGVKKVHRHGGSVGMNTFPARTFRGKRMAGRYGNTRTTVRNLKVVKIDEEQNLILVRGAIPGPNGGFVVIRETNKL
jgi:large subunit ribosomal protein L3